MNRWSQLSVVAVLAIGVAFALAQDAKSGGGKDEPAAGKGDAAAGPLCPVGKDPIDKKVYSYYKNRRVYFCCEKCKAKFDADPKEYAEGTKAQWALMKPLRIQVTCPGTGKPINKKVFVEGEDNRIYFCCDGCKGKWEKGDDAMAKKLVGEECFTYQTGCPMMKDSIDPAVHAEFKGHTVYFCCDECIGKFKKDVDGNLKKVDEQIQKNKAAFAKERGGAGDKPADKADEKPAENKKAG